MRHEEMKPSEIECSGLNASGIGQFKSTVNLVLTAVGVGVLALPRAIAQSGWAVGILLLVITWALSQAMMHLLWKCIETERRRTGKTVDSYGALGYAALGNAGRYIVSFSMYIGLSAICVIILILLGSGLYNLAPSMVLSTYIKIAALCILPLSWLPTLKEVGVLSALGVVAVGLVGIIVLVVAIVMDSDKRGAISAGPTEPMGLAMSFIEFMNSYTVAPVIPSIIAGMTDPSKYPRVATYGFATITFTFAVIGFAGYAGFGASLLDKGQGSITDLIATSSYHALSTVCQIAIVIVSLSHFLVMFNPVAQLSDYVVGVVPLGKKLDGKVGQAILRIVGRSAVIGLMLLAALYVPSFHVIVDLVASTVVMPLQVIFPILFFSIICRSELNGLTTPTRIAVYSGFTVAVCISLVGMGYGLHNVITTWPF